jgi:hypothetical protein
MDQIIDLKKFFIRTLLNTNINNHNNANSGGGEGGGGGNLHSHSGNNFQNLRSN